MGLLQYKDANLKLSHAYQKYFKQAPDPYVSSGPGLMI